MLKIGSCLQSITRLAQRNITSEIDMLCTLRLILIVTFFGLFGTTLPRTPIPEQETTSLWNVYEFEGSYSGDMRGYLIALWELTAEDLNEGDVQMKLDETVQDPFPNNEKYYIKNSGIDWEWEFTTQSGIVLTDRGKADDQIISSFSGLDYVCHSTFDGPMECIGTNMESSNVEQKEVYKFVEDGLNLEMWVNDRFYYVMNFKLQGRQQTSIPVTV